MKKSIWILFSLSTFCFLVTFVNTMSGLDYWSFQSTFLKQLEFFTFLLNHLFVILCLIQGIRALNKEKSWIYLIPTILPIAYLIFSWYFFFVRVIAEIFFS